MANVAFDEEESVTLLQAGAVRLARFALHVFFAIRFEHLLHRFVDELALQNETTRGVLVSGCTQLSENVKQQVIRFSVERPEN